LRCGGGAHAEHLQGKARRIVPRKPQHGAGDGDGNEKTGKPPDGGADVAAAKPVQCQSGWRNRVLCLCSAIFFIVAVSFLLPQKRDEVDGIKNRQHILMACIGFPVGLVLSFSLFFAALVQN
jgi:hypothetical protein